MLLLLPLIKQPAEIGISLGEVKGCAGISLLPALYPEKKALITCTQIAYSTYTLIFRYLGVFGIMNSGNGLKEPKTPVYYRPASLA